MVRREKVSFQFDRRLIDLQSKKKNLLKTNRLSITIKKKKKKNRRGKTYSMWTPLFSDSYWPIFLLTQWCIVTGIFIKLSAFLAPRARWWWLTIHHILSPGYAVQRSILSRSTTIFFFLLEILIVRIVELQLKSVAVIHLTERQLLNIPVCPLLVRVRCSSPFRLSLSDVLSFCLSYKLNFSNAFYPLLIK